jgi:phosphate/sulfate permease
MLASLIDKANGFVLSLTQWQQSTYMCSAESHAFLYTFIAGSVLIAAGGVVLWHRVIKTKPIPQLAA